MRRVVVSGLGVVAPNGVGKDAFWNACKNGVSGIGPIQSFDASQHPVRVAGEIRDFNVERLVPEKARKSLKVMGRAAKFGIGAAGLAVTDSGLDLNRLIPERMG
ncbi:MAG: beta-ketoacyl synthase N-terminal-like domain-containing protein, partial [Gemmataceae bacterium]